MGQAGSSNSSVLLICTSVVVYDMQICYAGRGVKIINSVHFAIRETSEIGYILTNIVRMFLSF